jgi:beta-glucosidase
MSARKFPDGFLWGSATASYQIEGGFDADGRGESIWDRFSKTPGKTVNGDTGDVACDHYHRYREDVALMKELGLQTYRFSIAWPRLFPTGSGPLNPKGLDFYSRLTDELLAAGIVPVPTLYHWDLPQTLEDAGGWPNIETAYRFADYAEAVFRGLGDRIKRFITLNEPWCTAFLGYGNGHHAPGRADEAAHLQAGHTLCMAHGLAVQRCRALLPDAEIGITDNFSIVHPTTDTEADRAAARRWDAYMNRWFMDPIYRGDYPEELKAAFGANMPVFTDEQRTIVMSPIDFIGVNYYSRTVMGDNPEGGALRIKGGEIKDAEFTEMGWEIFPRGLYETLVMLSETYNYPTLYVTENGAAFDDRPGPDGEVDDEPRRRYLRDHFLAAHDAIQAGVRLKGYYVWSLMDNFEWAFGYTKRFGIVYVDYPTQKRIPKKSARWYAEVIRANAVGEE